MWFKSKKQDYLAVYSGKDVEGNNVTGNVPCVIQGNTLLEDVRNIEREITLSTKLENVVLTNLIPLRKQTEKNTKE